MTVEEWLIDAVKVRPIIWNTKDENYKNTKMKNEAYNEIASESSMPGMWIGEHTNNLNFLNFKS